jgi:hypothetical protein
MKTDAIALEGSMRGNKMTKNLSKYGALVKKYDILSKYTKNCMTKLKYNKGNLEIKSQYTLFNEQLNEVRKELRGYDKMRISAKKGNYKKVNEMYLEKPELKEVLSKENLIDLINYYQKSIKKMEVKNKNLRLSKKCLETKLSNLRDNLEEIRRNQE